MRCDIIGDVPSIARFEVVDTAAKPASLNTADLVKHYAAGQSIVDLARINQCGTKRIRTLLEEAGVEIRSPGQAVRASGSRRALVNDAEIIRRYVAGESELALSQAFSLGRPSIRRRLIEAGVKIRTGSEANRLRMQRLTFQERANLAASANEARRLDSGWTGESYQEPFCPIAMARAPKVARTREVTGSVAYQVEDQIIDALVARGIPVRPQVAVHGYNLDIAVGNVAVEVHATAYNPGRHPRLVRRTVQLGEAGWSVLYVWITDAHPYIDRCANELVTHLDALQRLPPGIRQERVIRGSGELAAILCVDFDERTLVPAPEDPTNS